MTTTEPDTNWNECERCGAVKPYPVTTPSHGLLVCRDCACDCDDCRQARQ